MELVLILTMLLSYGIGYFIGKKNEGKNLEKHFYNAKAKEISDEVDNMVIDDMVRLAKEVPAELLANGNKERALHIAGVKEASKETQKEWEDERRAKIEAKQTKTIDDLLSTLNKAELQLKAGIESKEMNELLEKTKDKGKKIKLQIKEIDAIAEEKMKREAARKQAEKDKEERIKIDFEALNFSRISNEARKQIAEIVKMDLENKLSSVIETKPETEGGLGE